MFKKARFYIINNILVTKTPSCNILVVPGCKNSPLKGLRHGDFVGFWPKLF